LIGYPVEAIALFVFVEQIATTLILLRMPLYGRHPFCISDLSWMTPSIP
jgi:hypothetical protein